jgi:hypothetical protein
MRLFQFYVTRRFRVFIAGTVCLRCVAERVLSYADGDPKPGVRILLTKTGTLSVAIHLCIYLFIPIVNAVMSLRVSQNAGKLSSGYTIGGPSSTAQFHKVS